MSGRPQFTSAQNSIARAALAEFRELYQRLLDQSMAASALLDVLNGSAIPAPASAKGDGWWGQLETVGLAVDQMAEIVEHAEIVAPEVPAALRAAA